MCLGIFAGCTTAEPVPTGEQTQPVDTTPVDTAPEASLEDLESAAAYVKAMYQEGSDAISTPQSYNRIGSVNVAGVDYPVTWAVDVPENVAKVVANDDGSYTIEIIAEIEEDTFYTLSATVSNAAGQTAVVHFGCFIPAPLGSMTDIVDMAYALEDGETLDAPATLTGVITAIDTPYSSQYKNITVTIQVEGREDKPIMCYRLKGEGAEDLMPGDTITVTGNIKNYKGTIEFDAGCNLDKVVKGENSFEMPTDPKDIVNTAYELEVGQALPKQVTLTGLITSIDSVYSERYNNVSVWIVVEGMYCNPILCYRMKGADVDRIWLNDTITVTGILKNYQGTIEFDAGCTMDSWQNTGGDPSWPTNSIEAVEALYNLGENEAFPGIHSITGRVTEAEAYSLNYGNQTLTIEVPGAEGKPVICYRMTTGGNMDIKAGDYVTVRGNLEDYKGKKQLTNGYLTKWDPTTLEEALEEAAGLANNTYLPYASTVTGTIKINTPYNAQYKNITFTVTDDNGNEVYCYRLSGYGADQLIDGDVVTVKGNLTAYKGKPQFDKTATFTCERLLPKTLADQYEAAKSLANGDHLGIESTILGVISKIDQAYDPSYKNISFTVVNTDGISIYCYRLKGDDASKLEKNDTVQVVGCLTAYNGTPQFDSTATMTLIAKGEPDVVPENMIIFDDTAKRTTINVDQQVWEQNGIVFTNDKAGSTSNVNEKYYNPVRCYKGSTFTVSYPGMTNIVITCNSASYAEVVLASLPEGTVAGISDNVVTVIFDTPVDSFTTSGMTAQTRIDSITVNDPNAKIEAPVEPEIPATLAEQIEAAKALGSGSLPYDSTITGTVVITDAYNSNYKNVSFNVTNTDGITLFCKYTSGEGMDTLADGDTVTVTGKLECYNGNAQFYKATAVVVKEAETPDEGEGGETTDPSVGEPVTITTKFGTATTNLTAEQAVWTQNGITVTNDRNGAQDACYLNYKDGYEIRVYNGSMLTIAYTGMTKIVFEVNTYKDNYVSMLVSSLEKAGYIVSVEGTIVTVNLSAPADSISFVNAGTAQFRLNSITVYA